MKMHSDNPTIKQALDTLQRSQLAWGELDHSGTSAGIENALNLLSPPSVVSEATMKAVRTIWALQDEPTADISHLQKRIQFNLDILDKFDFLDTERIEGVKSLARVETPAFASVHCLTDIYNTADEIRLSAIKVEGALAGLGAIGGQIETVRRQVEQSKNVPPETLDGIIEQVEGMRSRITNPHAGMVMSNLVDVLRNSQTELRKLNGMIVQGDIANHLLNSLAQAVFLTKVHRRIPIRSGGTHV